MEVWMCSYCEKRIFGSLEVVLILASVHRCHTQLDPVRVTVCSSCLSSQTGLCAYHASLVVNQSRLNTTGFRFCEYHR